MNSFPPGTLPRPQVVLYYEAVRAVGEVNALFLELVKDGLTREELATNMKRRPGLWQRFEAWLERLPSRAAK